MRPLLLTFRKGWQSCRRSWGQWTQRISRQEAPRKEARRRRKVCGGDSIQVFIFELEKSHMIFSCSRFLKLFLLLRVVGPFHLIFPDILSSPPLPLPFVPLLSLLSSGLLKLFPLSRSPSDHLSRRCPWGPPWHIPPRAEDWPRHCRDATSGRWWVIRVEDRLRRGLAATGTADRGKKP